MRCDPTGARLGYRARMPRAILFDLYDTLVNGSTEADRRRVSERMAQDLGVDPALFANLVRDSARERFAGALGDLEGTVRVLAARAGVRPPDAAIRLACLRRVTMARALLWPSATTLHTLDALHRDGWRLGLVTNCSAETPALWKGTPFASRFHAVVFSCEFGVAKPDPAIFIACCSSLGVSPPECLYVGDGADDELTSAASLGMTVVQTTEYAPANGSWPKERIGAIADLRRWITNSGG